MAVKIYAKNNYFRLVDLEDNDRLYQVGKSEVKVLQTNPTSTTFRFVGLGYNKEVTTDSSGIQKENGDPYTVQEWEDFYTANSGKLNGGSTSLTTSQGWEVVSDDASSTIVAGTTPVKLTFNGLGSATETRYRPRGVSMYDITTNRFIPVNIGDAGELRISMESTNLTSNPTRIDIIFDIGSDNATPTIPIYTHPYTLKNVNVQPISMHFAWYQLETFLTNGGQIFAQVNSGTVTIGSRSIFNKKDMDGVEILNSQP